MDQGIWCFCRLICLLVMFILPGYCGASTITTTFQVSATINAACTVSATDLTFGVYNPIAGANLDVNTSTTVTCTNQTVYNIGLDAGQGSGATVAVRKMTQGGNTLNYSLYQDAGRTIVWGHTVGTDTVQLTGTGSGVATTIYGRIPLGQTTVPPSGSPYTDTITETITF